MARKRGKGKVLSVMGSILAELEAQPRDLSKKAQGKRKKLK